MIWPTAEWANTDIDLFDAGDLAWRLAHAQSETWWTQVMRAFARVYGTMRQLDFYLEYVYAALQADDCSVDWSSEADAREYVAAFGLAETPGSEAFAAAFVEAAENLRVRGSTVYVNPIDYHRRVKSHDPGFLDSLFAVMRDGATTLRRLAPSMLRCRPRSIECVRHANGVAYVCDTNVRASERPDECLTETVDRLHQFVVVLPGTLNRMRKSDARAAVAAELPLLETFALGGVLWPNGACMGVEDCVDVLADWAPRAELLRLESQVAALGVRIADEQPCAHGATKDLVKKCASVRRSCVFLLVVLAVHAHRRRRAWHAPGGALAARRKRSFAALAGTAAA